MSRLAGWGRFPRIEAETRAFDRVEEAAAFLGADGPVIARGLGRSYGDSSLQKRALLTTRYHAFLDFDAEKGILRCEAGVSLGEIIDVVLPRGWFPGVVPGTRFVTVGGAIASDVHGKNHHLSGSFSAFVRSFDLLTVHRGVVHCTEAEEPDLWRAACGGMGLAGVILSAELQLVPVASAFIDQTLHPAANLEALIQLFQVHKEATYSVAWIDCLARGERLGRGILMLGEHASEGGLRAPKKSVRNIPAEFPGFVLNRWSVGLFNRAWYVKESLKTIRSRVGLNPFFFPLDAIGRWNLIYGSCGFTQYQLVLPMEGAAAGVRAVLARIAAAGKGSFLSVLKLFGPGNDNLLSFPMEGLTLALDFKLEPDLFPFLESLDAIVREHGGRLYLTKDVRMDRAMLDHGYPLADRFRELRASWGADAAFQSLQSQRLGL